MTKISLQKNQKPVIMIASLALIVIILAFFFFRGGGGDREMIKQPAKEPAVSGAKAGSQVPKETRNIRLYFLSEEDGLLHAEERAIPADPSPVREAEAVIAELIKGPEKGYLSTIPPETRLRQIFITQDGTAYVDFSKEFAEKHPSGTSAEAATVYSIVNSLALNIPSIKKIVFLIEGGEKETLGGHINLSKPFIPLKSMIAK